MRASATATEQALGRAANKNTKNTEKSQMKQEFDTGESPILAKAKSENSNGKRLIQDDEEDELAQESKSPPQKKSRK